MIRYSYKARDKENKKVSGLVDAIDEAQALKTLRSRDLLVVGLKEKSGGMVTELRGMFQMVRKQDVLNFTRALSTMITAGLPLTEALHLTSKQSSPAMIKIIKQIVKEIEGGSSLYTAMGKHPKIFPKMYLALIKSGESAGVLDKILNRLANTLEKQKEFSSKIKGAMIYPIIVVIGMVVVAFVMVTFVIPQITDMFLEFNLDLPITTRILMAVSGFMASSWWLILILIAFLAFMFKRWYATSGGRFVIDDFLLKIPIYGAMYEKVALTEMTRTLSMLVAGGVSIIDSLNIVAEVTANEIYVQAIKTVAKEVEKGAPLGASMGKYPFFPPIIPQMMSIGEETGKLDEVLMKVSRHFELESEFAVKGLTSAIEPLMIILLGFGVGFLVVAVIMPIYQLTSTI